MRTTKCEALAVFLQACDAGPHACKAWMSKMTTLVGPPRDSGMLDRMRASVTAVATSPSASTC